MQTQPTVVFDGVAADTAVRDAVLAHVGKLESLCPDILGCHIVLSQPHSHPRRGRLWSVRIDLIVPGVDIIINRTHRHDHAHEDPLVAVHDAFEAACRRLQEHVRQRRDESKAHHRHDEGTIVRAAADGSDGVIATPDGREIHFDAHALSGCGQADVAAGTPVRFIVEDGDDGPQATWVGTNHAPASGQDAGRGEATP